MVNVLSNGPGHETHEEPKHGLRGIPWIYKGEGNMQGKPTWCGEQKRPTHNTYDIPYD